MGTGLIAIVLSFSYVNGSIATLSISYSKTPSCIVFHFTYSYGPE